LIRPSKSVSKRRVCGMHFYILLYFTPFFIFTPFFLAAAAPTSAASCQHSTPSRTQRSLCDPDGCAEGVCVVERTPAHRWCTRTRSFTVRAATAPGTGVSITSHRLLRQLRQLRPLPDHRADGRLAPCFTPVVADEDAPLLYVINSGRAFCRL
jgi:hypothetical protein